MSHLDRDFHSLKRAFPSAGKRHGLVLFANDGYRVMFGACLLVLRRIKTPPPGAGKLNLRPSVRGTMLAFGHLDVAAHKPSSESPVASGLHHKDGVVVARTAAVGECFAGKLNPEIVARHILKDS